MENNMNIHHELAAAHTKIAELKEINMAMSCELEKLRKQVAELETVTVETEVSVLSPDLINVPALQELANGLPGRSVSVNIYIGNEREDPDHDDDE